MRTSTAAAAATLAAALAMPERPATGQIAPLDQVDVVVEIDSGALVNHGPARGPVFNTTLRVPGAAWIRLRFDEAVLGPAPEEGRATLLRLTALAGGARQDHTAQTLRQWHNTSAYFNGDAVKLEVIADPGAEPSRVVVRHVLAGLSGPAGGGVIATICGPTDDRLPSSDARVARALPVGCTAWLISDVANCFLTAGHCGGPGLQVAEFNVPMSNADGTLNHPGPEDQYIVDPASKQFLAGGVGNDWCHFGCFPNTQTGLRPFEAQGAAFQLAATPPPVSGQTIRVTGHGTDTSPSQWNQIQQTHAGPYQNFNGSIVQYQVDTQGGNSGSPVIDEQSGEAIGIHTHGGCSATGGVNSGTGVNNAGLQSAIATPQGICLPAPDLAFAFPGGIPQFLARSGQSVAVEVSGANGAVPQPGSGLLHYDAGKGYISVPMVEVSPNVYDAVFPAIPCGTPVSFYFSAQTTEGVTVTDPIFAPQQVHAAHSAASAQVLFSDSFQQDLGWSVTSSASDGQWQRDVPIPLSVCNRGNPGTDADGSGQCYLTDNSAANACNSDVDGGATTLTSPIMDASAGLALVSYWRWFDNTGAGQGSNPFQDVFVVEVSGNGGASWVALESVGPAGAEVIGGWHHRTFLVDDFITPTNLFRIRFIAADSGAASVVEAAVDGVELAILECGTPGDLDGDGHVGIVDLLTLLVAWGPCPGPCPPSCAADLDGDCAVGIVDFLMLLANWG